MGPGCHFETGDKGSRSGNVGIKGGKGLEPTAQCEDSSTSSHWYELILLMRWKTRLHFSCVSRMWGGSQKLRAGTASPRPGIWDSEAGLGGEAEGWRQQPHPGGVTSLKQSWKEGLNRESRALVQGRRGPGSGGASECGPIGCEVAVPRRGGLEDRKGLGASWDFPETGLLAMGWNVRAGCSGREPLRSRSSHRWW